MTQDDIKRNLIFLLVGLVLGGVICFFFGRNSVAIGETGVKIERDTVTLHDTIHDHSPTPRDSGLVRWMVVRLPMERDSKAAGHESEHVIDTNKMIHDTVEVVLPVEQKHYQTENYQAWVSGYRPMLDSIEVYQKERIITETVTVTKKTGPKRWGIGFTGGWGYDFNSKTAAPYIGVGVSYNFVTF